MKNTEKSNDFSLKLWTIKYPLQHMLYTIGFGMISVALLALLGHIVTNPKIGYILSIILAFLPFVAATIIMLKKYSRPTITQQQFVGLYNVIIAICVVFLLFSHIIPIHENMPQLLANVMIIVFSVLGLYGIGLTVVDLYIKFRRIRSFTDIPTWKILCTWPFAYSMLWIPGYMTSDKNDTTKTTNNWYANFIKNIIQNKIALIFMLCLSFVLTHEFLMILIPCTILVVWRLIRGEKINSDLTGKYTTTAIIVNAVMVVFAIFAVSYIITHDADTLANIVSTSPTLQ